MKRKTMTTIASILLLIGSIIAQDNKAHAANAAQTFRTAGSPQSPQIKPTPKALKMLWLSGVTLNKTTTIGGAVDGDIIGTVRLLRPAVGNGVTVDLSLHGLFHVEAGIPVSLESSSVTIPSGKDSANFRIRSFTLSSYNYPLQYGVQAKYSDEIKGADFTLEALSLVAMTVVPPAGIGPFAANGTVKLNARPAAGRTVTLTSSNPNVVRFGSIGSAQNSVTLNFSSNESVKTFPVVASPVTLNTAVTITATMNGRTVAQQVTVRPPL